MNRAEQNQLNRWSQDKQLKHYAQEAQKHPRESLAHRQALDKLVRIVIMSERLYRPSANRLPPQCRGAYREIYSDALQSLMLYLCQNIHHYNPDKASFMGWVNMLMDRRFINIGIQQFQDGRERRLGRRRRLQDLRHAEEEIPAPEEKKSTCAELRQFIVEDPSGLLQKKHLQNHPDITLQMLLSKKLDGQTWDDMAKELEIPLPTLHSFFRRALKDLSPVLKEYLEP